MEAEPTFTRSSRDSETGTILRLSEAWPSRLQPIDLKATLLVCLKIIGSSGKEQFALIETITPRTFQWTGHRPMGNGLFC